MAKEGGGGGAFGWTLLGFLAGVAATLGLQVLISGDHHPTAPTMAEAPAPVHVVVASSAPVVKPEFDACARAAESAGVSVRTVIEEALARSIGPF